MPFWADVVPRRHEYAGGQRQFRFGKKTFNGRERNCLFRNRGGLKFDDVAYVLGVDGIEDGRGGIAADLDGDLWPEIVVSNHRVPSRLWRHRGVPGARLLVVRPRASARGNPEAVGAIVTCEGPGVPTQARPITAGTGYLSQEPPEARFGLGVAKEARVSVLWPGGKRTTVGPLAAGAWEVTENGGTRRLPR
ncbi:MAG: CRTAC1 family protein [Planctomycetales bacterium]|nr:CRTAC1 family protein [Planctomycetales bacterium]